MTPSQKVKEQGKKNSGIKITRYQADKGTGKESICLPSFTIEKS